MKKILRIYDVHDWKKKEKSWDPKVAERGINFNLTPYERKETPE